MGNKQTNNQTKKGELCVRGERKKTPIVIQKEEKRNIPY